MRKHIRKFYVGYWFHCDLWTLLPLTMPQPCCHLANKNKTSIIYNINSYVDVYFNFCNKQKKHEIHICHHEKTYLCWFHVKTAMGQHGSLFAQKFQHHTSQSYKDRAGRKGHITLISAHELQIQDTKSEKKSTLHIVCWNEDRDVKLTVGGRLFHAFITRHAQ